MKKTELKEKLNSLCQGYTSYGGYPLIGIMEDGGIICPKCAREEKGQIYVHTINRYSKDWSLAGVDVYWEGAPIQCDNCNADIESAYGDPS